MGFALKALIPCFYYVFSIAHAQRKEAPKQDIAYAVNRVVGIGANLTRE